MEGNYTRSAGLKAVLGGVNKTDSSCEVVKQGLVIFVTI
jgi:hypothetical protein